MSNEAAFPGPYIDSGITVRNPPHHAITPTPARSGSATLGEITVYDDSTTDHDPGDQGADSPAANPPTPWAPGRDPYKNNGMVGQDFLKNYVDQ